MVDCGSSRCAQDRRVLKKELLSWTKKVPILLGLEQIAERYAGKEAFRELMLPFNGHDVCDTEIESEDWRPTETCCFCQMAKHANSPTESCAEHEESYKPPDQEGLDYYQHYLPLAFPPPLPLEGDTVTPDNSKPLDLSASSRYHGDQGDSGDGQPLIELKVPQITNKAGKKKDGSGKRSYTDEDLSAAVEDIRSGKLGTRRAAALYGIPRSTLRNKIFRLETENHQHHHAPPTYDPAAFDPMTYDPQLSMADLLQNMAAADNACAAAAKVADWSPEEWEVRLDQLRRKHDLNERPFGMPPLFFSPRHLLDCEKAFNLSSPYDYDIKLPFLHELVRKFAEHRMEADRAQSLGMPFLSELMQANGAGHDFPSLPANMAPNNGPVELKIPSYKPIRSTNGTSPPETPPPPHHHNNNNKINDTLKDIIAKSIAEKVRSRTHPDGDFLPADIHGNGYSDDRHGNGFPVVKRECTTPEVAAPSPAKKIKTEPGFNQQKAEDSSNQTPTKKTRPKRGQYRKYNSQLLLEAVRAVQRGEMSVHRAGSYFGVPHSTLEYKVKERHLMRQKKPREARGKKSSTASTTSTNSSTKADLNIPTPGGTTKPSSTPSEPTESPAEATSTATVPEVTDEEESSSDLEPGECPRSEAASSRGISPLMMSSEMDALSGSHALLSTAAAAAAAAAMPLPPALPPNFYLGGGLPMGFPWPPMLNGGMPPLGMPDPAAFLPPYGLNLSASDLLKKLQQKVQAKAAGMSSTVTTSSSATRHDVTATERSQDSKAGGGSQVIVK